MNIKEKCGLVVMLLVIPFGINNPDAAISVIRPMIFLLAMILFLFGHFDND